MDNENINAFVSTSTFTKVSPQGSQSKEISVIGDLVRGVGKMRVREEKNGDIMQKVQDLTPDELQKISERRFVPRLECDKRSCRISVNDDGDLSSYRSLFRIEDLRQTPKPKTKKRGRKSRDRQRRSRSRRARSRSEQRRSRSTQRRTTRKH